MSGPTTSAGLSLAQRRLLATPGLERSLVGKHPVSPQEELRAIVAELDTYDGPQATWDRYGEGGPVSVLENQVGALLGKPAAVMFPSGIMAQQSVLRVWSDRVGSRRIAVPQVSHLLLHEQDGPTVLNDFDWALLTNGPVVPTAEHLAAIPGGLGAALLELPLRDGGYLLPSWEELGRFRSPAAIGVCRCTWMARGSGSPLRTWGTPRPRSRRWPTRCMYRSTRACAGWPARSSPGPRTSSPRCGSGVAAMAAHCGRCCPVPSLRYAGSAKNSPGWRSITSGRC